MELRYFDHTTQWMIYIVVFYFGAIMASFLTCQAERIAMNKDWVHGHSVCDSCLHELKFVDLIPIFSYLFHKGRCKYCNSKIPMNCLLGELGLGVLSVLMVRHYGISVLFVRNMILVYCLFGLSIVDLRIYIIPDGYLLVSLLAFVISSFFLDLPYRMVLKDGFFGGITIAGMLYIISLIFDHITKKESLGGGDIKLFFVVGLYLGFACSLLNLLIACVIGLLFVGISKQNKIPFGPSISVATVFTLLYGMAIVNWYLSLF